MKKTVLVTGIGGVVGQGILRNLRSESLDIGIVGTNTTAVSAGNHLCDSVHVMPFAYDPAYAGAMADVVAREGVDLIIPSTDYESYYLMLAQPTLGCTVAAAPADVTAMCLDKYVNFQKFEQKGLRFAKSWLPSAYPGGFDRTVVKPREGRGSRNIFVDPENPRAFGDDYVVQEYLDGEELTTTFYVRKDGSLHGMITFARELEQGNTARCEVVTRHDRELRALVESIIAAFPFRGSCNLQTRATSAGVVPFEINCRISGTNSVRSQFGFRDVAYTVQEYLFGRQPDAPAITAGSAIRVIMDIIYPDLGLDQIRDRFDKHRIY